VPVVDYRVLIADCRLIADRRLVCGAMDRRSGTTASTAA